jgi:preprotein translocase subunit SecA
MPEGLFRLPDPRPVAERPDRRPAFWDRVAAGATAPLQTLAAPSRLARLRAVADAAEQAGRDLAGLSDAALQVRAAGLRRALHAEPDWPDPVLAASLGLVREAARRVLGQQAYPVQLTGAAAVLRGMAAEMATGEGKTLVAMLAAATAALGGVPTHVVTVNRYLAERDAAAGAPLYAFLGLTCGCVTDAVPPDRRAAAYRCDITVCTSKDLAFDYLRDRLAAGRRVGPLRRRARALAGGASDRPTLLRGLHYAIIDEADSVLIDEARTPLVLAGRGEAPPETALYDTALAIADRLRAGTDYALLRDERRIVLLRGGRAAIAAASPDASPWDEAPARERLVELALTALHTLHRDEHYVVRDGRAEIVDEYTGRIMPDRSWNDGLQEAVERKEGLALSERHVTQARMTYQRFFRRYRRLAGMSGTLGEVAGELWRTYRLPVAAIPRHRPDRKVMLPCRAYPDSNAKWDAIAATVAGLHAAGAPVLIGTRTVAASACASAALDARGLPHVVLNAVRDAQEARIIVAAGQAGAITVATNMAGRGTDIRPTPEALAGGGLHVVLSEWHEASRIDRQLAGRCGRQGEPGAVLPFCARDDTLLRHHGGLAVRLPGLAIRLVARLAQRRAERLHRRMRADLLRSDDWLDDMAAFAGESE